MLERIGRWLWLYLIVPFTIISSYGFCGDPLVIHPATGRSIVWGDSTAIPYWIDNGPLGALSNDAARSIVEKMMEVWSSVDTASVGFQFQGYLPEDVTAHEFPDYLAMVGCGASSRGDIPKDVVPIIFDSDGSIIDLLMGEGASYSIGGISTLRCFTGSADDPRNIYQGMVILNGGFIDGKGIDEGSPADIPLNVFAGIILHELGHLLGLDHSYANDWVYDGIARGDLDSSYARYLPVMFPMVLRSSPASTSLRPDDIAAISSLYPSAGYASLGSIVGEVVSDTYGEIKGGNVVARRIDDPLCEAFSSVTGKRCVPLIDGDGKLDFNSMACGDQGLYGDFRLEGLPPGEYTVEVSNISDAWITDTPSLSLKYSPLFETEFYNEGDKGDGESGDEKSIIHLGASEEVDGIDISVKVLKDGDKEEGDFSFEFEEGKSSRCVLDSPDIMKWLDDVSNGAVAPTLSEYNGIGRGVGMDGGGCTLVRAPADSRKARPSWYVIPYVIAYVFFRASSSIRTRRVLHTLLLVAPLVLLMPALLLATSVVPSTLEEMSLKAGKIFYGRCIKVEQGFDENGLPAIFVKYSVERGIKGVSGGEVEFKVFGEDLGSRSTLDGSLPFREGEEDVLFLYKESRLGFTSPVGIWQGRFRVVGEGSAKRVVMPKGVAFPEGRAGYKSVGTGTIVTPDGLLDLVSHILKGAE